MTLDEVVELAASYGIAVDPALESVLEWVLSGQAGRIPESWWFARWADSEARRRRWARQEAARPLNRHLADLKHKQRGTERNAANAYEQQRD